MQLWLLKPVEGDPNWEPRYDMCFGLVIRAESEVKARELAQTKYGEEDSYFPSYPAGIWKDPTHVTCVELLQDGPEEVIIHDIKNA